MLSPVAFFVACLIILQSSLTVSSASAAVERFRALSGSYPPFEYDEPRFGAYPLVKRNRMCLINAGLSQGCDLSDILMAKQQASKFMSFAGPGR
ncbi:unnamed protein product [Auanema sp. JU1783]|nr:unnamed protein product [Auanema sp. JU1783]